jgi:hypothetical protein
MADNFVLRCFGHIDFPITIGNRCSSLSAHLESVRGHFCSNIHEHGICASKVIF